MAVSDRWVPNTGWVRYAVSRRSAPAAVLGVAGAGLLLRAITNTYAKRLVGAGGGRRGVEVHKTINLAAPIDEVIVRFVSVDQTTAGICPATSWSVFSFSCRESRASCRDSRSRRRNSSCATTCRASAFKAVNCSCVSSRGTLSITQSVPRAWPSAVFNGAPA